MSFIVTFCSLRIPVDNEVYGSALKRPLLDRRNINKLRYLCTTVTMITMLFTPRDIKQNLITLRWSQETLKITISCLETLIWIRLAATATAWIEIFLLFTDIRYSLEIYNVTLITETQRTTDNVFCFRFESSSYRNSSENICRTPRSHSNSTLSDKF